MTADALREWRTARSLSQRQLAEALGVSVRTIQEWEQGRRPGPPGNIMMLALASLDRMIGLHDPAIPKAE